MELNNTVLKRFSLNTSGKDYVVGDIHGMFSLLQSKLDEINFNPDVDRLFSVGDNVDRGEESDQVDQWLTKPWFHSVRGNHEDMIIHHYMWRMMDMIGNGAKWWLDLDINHRDYYIELFDKLPLVIEVETKSGKVGIVHAECPVRDWEKIYSITQEEAECSGFEGVALWARSKINRMDESLIPNVDKIFVGHTSIVNPLVLGNTHYIDTGAVWTGKLTIVELV
jgi:serine/threonine protein phosphatase 1